MLREHNVASAIVGASRPEQLDENAAAAEVTVDPALFAKAEAIAAEVAGARRVDGRQNRARARPPRFRSAQAWRPDAGGRDLTDGPITRTLLLFSLPLLGGNALQSLNVTVNQIWVSHTLGETAITALGNANIVMMLMLGAIFGVGMAANILVAQAVGAEDLPLVKRVMGTTTIFFIVLSVALADRRQRCSRRTSST